MTELVRQSLRFGVVGLANTAIGLAAIYALMFFWDVSPSKANALGYSLGMTVSFVLNRVWTFGSNRSVAQELPKYLLVVAVSYLLNLGLVITAISNFAFNPYLAQLLGVGVYTVFVFSGCRRFVFVRHRALVKN